MKFKYVIVLLAALFLTKVAAGQEYEQSRQITRSFPLTAQSTVKVANKYGNIMFATWDKDSVAFTITIKVSDKKESDAANKLSAIDVQFTSNPYFINAQTVFKDNKTAFGVDFSAITNNIFNSSRNVSIEYNISLPAWVAVDVQNKYGSVYSTDHSGSFTLNLSNGDFKAGSLSGQSTINVDFGNITLNSVTNSRMEIGYSELVLKRAGNLHIGGHSGKCWINNVEALDLDSKRDKFYIDTLRTLSGQSGFSYIQIGLLDISGTLKSNYGDLRINNTGLAFTGINLNSEWTDIVLGLPQNMTFSLLADYKKTVVTLPVAASGIKAVLTDEKLQQYHMSGMAGPGTVPTADILLNASGGSFTIQIK
jgi:hypothetical protein